MLERGLQQLREALPCDIDPVESLTGGKSAGPVAVIARSGPGFNDKVAVKILHSSEEPKWQSAIRDCPKGFNFQHLADLELCCPWGQMSANGGSPY